MDNQGILHYISGKNRGKMFMHSAEYIDSNVEKHDALEIVTGHVASTPDWTRFDLWRKWYYGGLFFNNKNYWIVWGMAKNDVNNYINGLKTASDKLIGKLSSISAQTGQNNVWIY